MTQTAFTRGQSSEAEHWDRTPSIDSLEAFKYRSVTTSERWSVALHCPRVHEDRRARIVVGVGKCPEKIDAALLTVLPHYSALV